LRDDNKRFFLISFLSHSCYNVVIRMVRITGYSAVFVDMSNNAPDEIIRRQEIGYRFTRLKARHLV
jgi:hypothetical protein